MKNISSIESSTWTTMEKIGFRFSFIYLGLFIIFKNNGAFPYWPYVVEKPSILLEKFIPWIGEHVLNLSYEFPVYTGGSGDGTFSYIVLLLFFVVALFGTLIWSLLDKKRTGYKKLYYWLTVAIRFYVALMLINYGLFKVIKLQFSYPSFNRLLQPYGESSPMGLAWTFLGFSKGYNIFMGILEILAGLMLFRRTMTVGAIITLMAALNVMMVNYFYDVPVKIVSTHLVIMVLFLLSNNIKQLIRFFFTNSPVQLSVINRPFEMKKPLFYASYGIKYLIIGYALIYAPIKIYESQYTWGSKAPKPALYGLYEVSSFISNNDTIPANIEDKNRWRYLIMERKGRVSIHMMDKSRIHYKTTIDTILNKLTFENYRDTTEVFVLNYKKTDSTLNFETIFKNDTLKVNTKRLTKNDFLLMNRGYHWINERPFNR